MKGAHTTVSLICLLLILAAFIPAAARASALGDLFAFLVPVVAAQNNAGSGSGNIDTMQLPKPATNIDPVGGTGGGDIDIVDSSALVSQEGPSGTLADIVKPKNGSVSTYVVRPGDTLSVVAKLFGVTPGTITSINDIPNGSKLVVGQKLTILPITSIPYTVLKGDTIASIAKKTGGDVGEIESFNNIDDTTLQVGASILIPNGEAPTIVATKPTTNGKSNGTASKSKSTGKVKIGAEPAHNVGPDGSASEIAYYIAPLSSYVETQGIHGYNAVDLAAPSGTPIVASATGDVVVAREGGWNGGYGSYVVIQHDNGSQTLYAHMSKVSTYDGAHVVQGQVIGYVGQTGLATGPHVHFEIRNGIKNPF